MTNRMNLRTALLALATLTPAAAFAQAPTATLHGHVQNAAAQPIKGATVQFTRQLSGELKDRKWDFKTTTDANGDYKITDVTPGELFGDVAQDGKNLDYIESVKVVAGENKLVDFDMTRAEFVNKMSPEDKAALEEYKKKIASTTASNKVVANLNATLAHVRADLSAAAAPNYGDTTKDIADMKSAVDSKPDESVLWIVYADTLQAHADHVAHEDRVAKKSPLSDDEVTRAYTDALAAYQKGVDLNAASKKPTPTDQAIAYNAMGNINGKMNKVPEASAAFDNAVKLDPAKGGMYFNNEAAILYNNNQFPGALAAAQKAIDADPTRPVPFYIKGQVLVQQASLDTKTGKYVVPDGCQDAYQRFIALAGNDPQYAAKVKDVTEVVTAMGLKVDVKYVAPKGKK